MSQNSKDETNAIAIGMAFVGAALMAIAFFIAALLAFAAFVLTILAIIAWNEPLILGRIVIQPDEARAFVYRGLFGAVCVPAFFMFCAVVLGVPIEWDYFYYFVLGGYVAGSIGIEIAMAEEAGTDETAQPQPMQHINPPQQPQRALPSAPREPFRYASWEDEEENGR